MILAKPAILSKRVSRSKISYEPTYHQHLCFDNQLDQDKFKEIRNEVCSDPLQQRAQLWLGEVYRAFLHHLVHNNLQVMFVQIAYSKPISWLKWPIKCA